MLPDANKNDTIQAFYTALKNSFLKGAENSRTDLSSLCVNCGTWEGGGLLSVWYDVAAYKTDISGNPSLAVYKRIAHVWDLKSGLIISENDFMRRFNIKKSKSSVSSDGFFVSDGKPVFFKNRFKPGADKGMRRSQYKNFIELDAGREDAQTF